MHTVPGTQRTLPAGARVLAGFSIAICYTMPRRDTRRSGQCLNAPGNWDVMISYTQRNGDSKVLAEALYNSFRDQRLTVWLDIKMSKLNEAAMEAPVQFLLTISLALARRLSVSEIGLD